MGKPFRLKSMKKCVCDEEIRKSLKNINELKTIGLTRDAGGWATFFPEKELSFFDRMGGGRMSIKAAVASNDGQSINEHFGRARHFLIFDLVEEHFILAEVREIVSPHSSVAEHDSNAIDRIIEALADCRFVLAGQIGPGAVERLGLHGIKGFTISGSIDKVLEKLASSYEIRNLQKVKDDKIGEPKKN